MNDEEIGRALGRALAPPPLRAAPDAGSRLRAAARGRRRHRTAAAGSALSVVLALAGVVAVTRGGPAPDGGGGPPAGFGPTASSPRLAELAVPVRLSLPDLRPSTGTCTGGLRCVPPATFLTVRETTALAVDGRSVRLELTAQDAATAAGRTGLRAALGAAPVGTASVAGRLLRIDTADPGTAAQVARELALDPVPEPRTGPGRLDRPLAIWSVRSSEPGPCRVSPAAGARDVLVVDQAGACLVLAGPPLTIATADLQVQDGSLRVGLTEPADRIALGAYTRRHTGDAVAFRVGDRTLPTTPVVEGAFDASIELSFDDDPAALAATAAWLRS